MAMSLSTRMEKGGWDLSKVDTKALENQKLRSCSDR